MQRSSRALHRRSGSSPRRSLLVALLPRRRLGVDAGHARLSSARRCCARCRSCRCAIADLLRAFPYDFLYGSIAADTSIAKKYVPTGRHCHSWTVGLEIHDAGAATSRCAPSRSATSRTSPPTRSRTTTSCRKQLAVTASTSSLGHSYWESRFETHLGPACAAAGARADPARPLARGRRCSTASSARRSSARRPTGASSAAWCTSPTTKAWQRIFGLMTENSRWDLTDDGGRPLHGPRRTTAIMDLLMRFERSRAVRAGPVGRRARCALAKRVRREALRTGGAELRARRGASATSGCPAVDARLRARRSAAPLYDAEPRRRAAD